MGAGMSHPGEAGSVERPYFVAMPAVPQEEMTRRSMTATFGPRQDAARDARSGSLSGGDGGSSRLTWLCRRGGLELAALEPQAVLVVLAVAAAGNALLTLTLMIRAGRPLGPQGRAM
jgi:hypothetical protein